MSLGLTRGRSSTFTYRAVWTGLYYKRWESWAWRWLRRW